MHRSPAKTYHADGRVLLRTCLLRTVCAAQCAPLTVRPGETKVAAGDTTATTDFTPNHAAKAPVDTPCMLELSLESAGEPFKLIALHVRSAMVAAVASR